MMRGDDEHTEGDDAAGDTPQAHVEHVGVVDIDRDGQQLTEDYAEGRARGARLLERRHHAGHKEQTSEKVRQVEDRHGLFCFECVETTRVNNTRAFSF